MRRFLGAVLATVLVTGLGVQARADDQDTKGILDKAIKALGGEEKLSKVKAVTYKTKGKVNFGGNENPFTSEGTVEGLDHLRRTIDGEFNGNKARFAIVVAGDKGWRVFGEKMVLDKDGLANEKRNLYLEVLPVTLVPLKEAAYKIAAAGEDKVDGKPAAGLKVTAPDGKDFTLYFDRESGLPVKLVTKIVDPFMGNEHDQETTYADYKDFDGIKKATKIAIKRDGEKFIEQTITDFKVVDKVDPKTFEEPKDAGL